MICSSVPPQGCLDDCAAAACVFQHTVFWMGRNSRYKIPYSKIKSSSSSQDGDVGRDPSLPPTTKRRITTNLKSINNQMCQKIKLYGILTTKELKKKSSRTTRPARWKTMRADSEKRRCWDRPLGPGWLPSSAGCLGGADLRGLRVGCGLWRLQH